MALLKTRDGNGGDLALLDQMFGSFFDWQLPTLGFTYAGAPLDLYEKDGKYVIEVATPGYDPKEIDVEVTGGTVTISGEHFEKSEKTDLKYHRREMRRGAFSRTITLPQDLDADSVKAKVDKGVLKVELTPVKPIAAKRIAVTAAS